jgi:hypothetical protein
MSRETDMDETIGRLDTPQRLEQFAINVEGHHPGHAQKARRRAIELQAATHGATTDAQREAFEAVYAYERAQSHILGRKFRASRTWPMIRRRGIIPAVEFVVTQRDETPGFPVLSEMGLLDKAFEAVVLRHPDVFSPEAVKASDERLQQYRDGQPNTGETAPDAGRTSDSASDEEGSH